MSEFRFSGSVELTADDKNRFRFPAKYREWYASTTDEVSEVYILKTLNSKFLTILPKSVADKLIDQLQSKMVLTETRESKIARYYLSRIEASKVDTQGRFIISSKQMGDLHIGKEILMIGAGSQIQVWNKADYEADCLELEEQWLKDEADAERTGLDDIVIGL